MNALAHPPVCYADQAWYGEVEVLDHVRLARDTYRVRLAAPQIAERIVPGQFVMLRLPGCQDPLLGRPLALYDTVLDAAGRPVAIDVVFLVVGKLTGSLARIERGARLVVWGPLGNGFPPAAVDHLVMVAGGIGQTPFPALAREYRGLRDYGGSPRAAARASRVSLCYGARSAEYLAGLDDFAALGVETHLSTDDGSAGQRGLVTEVLGRVLADHRERLAEASVRVVCCGPEKMIEAVARLTAEARVPCQVSLETPMACGLGICFSCVARVRDEQGGWDYRRTCVEGPVFEASAILF